MNIVLMGAPGAGKGTQAYKISQKYKLVHISTGDILRENIKLKTELGIIAKELIDRGMFVSDEVMISIVQERITKEDCKNGFILDGFPRTKNQAEILDKIINIDKVVNINIDLSLLVSRLVGRRVCRNCGKSYHIDSYSLSSCEVCSGEIYQRADDTEETVSKRIDIYINQTAPLIEYYKSKGNYDEVEGGGNVAEVFEKIQKVL